MALTRPRYSQIYDTDYKQSVRLATTADVGNLLAGGSNITNTVDGKTVADNDRILVKDQADGKQNGIYRVATAGTGSNGTWIRALDADASDKVTSGLTTTVTDGDTNINKTFKLATQDPITVGTTSLSFVDPFQITASAGGANTYVQFNDVNQLNGTAGFTFNKYTNAVSIAGSITTSNLVVNGNISASYLLGDGSQLTGIDATSIQNGTTSVRTYNSNDVAIKVAGSNVAVFTSANTRVTGNVYIAGSILPLANITYDLGSPTQRFRSGYFSGNTIYIGGESMSVDTNGKWSFTSSGSTVDLGGGSDFASATINTSGNVTVGGNLFVSGAVYIAGNTTSISTNNLSLSDSLIYLAEGNPTDFLDIGFIGNFTRSALYSHTGFARDATDGVWKLFEGVEPEPTTTIDFGSASYGTMLLGNVVTRANVTVGGNIRLGRALLSSAGVGGDPGQYLTSTGTGIAWTTLEVSTSSITDGSTTTVYADTNVVNVEVGGSNVASFSSTSATITGNLNLGGAGRQFIKADFTNFATRAMFQTTVADSETIIQAVPNGTSNIARFRAFNSSDLGDYVSVEVGAYSTDARISATRAGSQVPTIPLTFYTYGSERMRISTVGNVGIGNTNPLHTLSVSGNAYVSGTIFGTASSARYADLAEVYTSDRNYIPGTVVVFGGDKEVTVSLTSHDPSVAGVISTNPAYIMNSDCDGVFVALQGRVPCRVLGPVSKGDRVVTSEVRGVAERLDMTKYQPGCIIGKSLESVPNGEIATIEVVVGRN